MRMLLLAAFSRFFCYGSYAGGTSVYNSGCACGNRDLYDSGRRCISFPSGVIVRYALIGEIMAYTSAVTMCARPVGQMESF